MASQTVFEELSELEEPQESGACMSERLSARSAPREVLHVAVARPVINASAALTGVTGL
jgi:hypothetical protein